VECTAGTPRRSPATSNQRTAPIGGLLVGCSLGLVALVWIWLGPIPAIASAPTPPNRPPETATPEVVGSASAAGPDAAPPSAFTASALGESRPANDGADRSDDQPADAGVAQGELDRVTVRSSGGSAGPRSPDDPGNTGAAGDGGAPQTGGVGQNLFVVVPPHDVGPSTTLPPTTVPATTVPTTTPTTTGSSGSNGSSGAGSAGATGSTGSTGSSGSNAGSSAAAGPLPRTGLDALTWRLAVVGLALVDVGLALCAIGRRAARRPARSGSPARRSTPAPAS
jgi:hypothetical protein